MALNAGQTLAWSVGNSKQFVGFLQYLYRDEAKLKNPDTLCMGAFKTDVEMFARDSGLPWEVDMANERNEREIQFYKLRKIENDSNQGLLVVEMVAVFLDPISNIEYLKMMKREV